MPEMLIMIPAFIVAIGVLVTVHEWGHFIVARKLGVKVLRFSIGFGPGLWSKTAGDGTEYRVAAIPLGGYVKMLDEREGDVPAEELEQAFNRQALWKRNLIVLAGPAMNFLFAILAYWLIFVTGVPGIRPVIDQPPESTVAWHAGLRGGEEFISLKGKTIETWDELRMNLIESALDGEWANAMVRTQDHGRRIVRLDLRHQPVEPDKLFDALGLHMPRPPLPAQIDRVVQDGPAQQAGLMPGDRILAVDDQPVADWYALLDIVMGRAGDIAVFKISRQVSTRELAQDSVGKLSQHWETHLIPIKIASVEREGKQVGQIGVYVTPPSEDVLNSLATRRQYGPLESVIHATDKTWQLSVLTVELLYRMVLGDVSWKNISGPIQIAQYAGYTASAGLVSFLGFLALVSVSLGVLNLLPIPVLDGGHLLYHLFEWIKGAPLSEPMLAFGQRVGLLLLLMLMSLALYNDVLRLASG